MSGPVVIFLGPSLGLAEARALLPQARFLPPARQGDVYRAVRDCRPARIGLIDGLFLNVPAVWHREILWALDQGVAVFGSASMGALRAAELADYGMIGIGKICAAFRAGRYPPFDDPFEDDDEVAVAHAPEALGSMAISDAMVDLRETLAVAEVDGLIDSGERDRLAAAMKRLHFPERSFARLAEAAEAELEAGRAGVLTTWLESHRVSQKALDAVELIGRLARGEAAPEPVPFELEKALVWERFVEAEEDVDASPDEAAVLAELGLDPQAWRDAAYAAMGRMAVGRLPEETDVAAALARFRRRRNLTSRASIEAWLGDNAAGTDDLPRLVAAEAAAEDGLVEVPLRRLRRAVLDHLRLTGAFAALHRRARDKAATTGGDAAHPSEPLRDGALSWYFEKRLGAGTPASVAAHAASVGFAHAEAFEDAVWREFVFVSGARDP